jgi:catechol 2,3-dioxygenase-like lactoylglutathione lyase family enzyme
MTETAILVRIIVADVEAAVGFYTGPLGFSLDVQTPVFAAVMKDGLKLWSRGRAAVRTAGGRRLSGF